MRRRTALPLLAAGALLVPTAPAAAASFNPHLKAPGHHPTAGKKWTIRVSAGKGVRATAYYQFLYGDQVVSTQYPSPHGPARHKPYRFKGHYRDPIKWPKRSVGYPLKFRVVVAARGETKHLDYKVRVQR